METVINMSDIDNRMLSSEFTSLYDRHQILSKVKYAGLPPFVDDSQVQLLTEINKREDAPSIFTIVWQLIKATPLLISILPLIIKFFTLFKKENFMDNSTLHSTTNTIIDVVAALLKVFNVNVTQEVEDSVHTLVNFLEDLIVNPHPKVTP